MVVVEEEERFCSASEMVWFVMSEERGNARRWVTRGILVPFNTGGWDNSCIVSIEKIVAMLQCCYCAVVDR